MIREIATCTDAELETAAELANTYGLELTVLERADCEARGMGGTYRLDGSVDFTRQPHLEARVTGRGIDAHELFTQAENFGQSFIEARHLSGILDARTRVDAYWDETGSFRYDALRVSAEMTIRDGRLRDFALLENFEDYANRKALRDVRFDRLNGFLEVRRGEVWLCETQIESNAGKMAVSGRHTFEQDFLYALKVDATSVLARKLFGDRKNKSRDAVGIYLNYIVEGDAEDFRYERDKDGVSDIFRRSANVQRRITKELKVLPGLHSVTARLPAERDRRPSLPPSASGDETEDEYLDFGKPGGRE